MKMYGALCCKRLCTAFLSKHISTVIIFVVQLLPFLHNSVAWIYTSVFGANTLTEYLVSQ